MKFIERAIHALEKREVIEAIDKLARDQMGSGISIGFPIYDKDKNNIHFIVDKTNSTTNLGHDIAQILGYNYEDADDNGDVVIFNNLVPSQTISEYVDSKKIISLTVKNYNAIQVLLKKHYPEYYRDTNIDAQQDKRRRSVSPSSIFSQKDSSQRDDHEAADKIVEHLKGSPLWAEIKRSPEVLDEAYRRAKRALSAEQAVGMRPTGAAK